MTVEVFYSQPNCDTIVIVATPSYAPFEIIDSAKNFRLLNENIQTAFGNLHYCRTEVTGDTVKLFLHGVGGAWASWTPILQQASFTRTKLGDCIFVDLPGFGDSQNRTDSLDVKSVGELLLNLVGDLGWSKVELIGHSMGGFLALDMASRRQFSSTAITRVLIVSGAYFSIVSTVNHPWKSLLSNSGPARTYMSMKCIARLGSAGPWLVSQLDKRGQLRKIMGRLFASPDLLPNSIVSSVAKNMRPGAFVLAAKNGKGYDARELWAQIACPLVATFGGVDQLVPWVDAQDLRACQPHARIISFEDVGHFAQVERPDLVLPLVIS